uniref:Shugoshin_C domain-containing protein n=1 Tax=Ascaris lumbricoides TaxID=6252 RepID=A0A0M3IJ65_ASCLU
MKRMDSQCSRKRESQNQPSGALFMDKDGFANRLRQMKSIGSADANDPSMKKESKIEKLDLSKVTHDDPKENITEEKNVTGEDVNSGEEACIENDDESPSKKLVDTSSTDSIKATSEVAFPEETMTPKQFTDREDGKNDMDVRQKNCSIGETGNDVPEAIDDDSRPRKPSIAGVSDADSVIMGLEANRNTHTDASALIRSTRKKANSDAKQIAEKQKEKRSYSYSKKVIPPIGRGRYASDANSQPSKINQDTSRAKGFWSRCPCETIKSDPQLKTKVCSII